MGLYVGRIYAEVKGRPLYVIDRAVGFEAEAEGARRPAPRPRDPHAADGGVLLQAEGGRRRRPERSIGSAPRF
jgi:hypothetical protein